MRLVRLLVTHVVPLLRWVILVAACALAPMDCRAAAVRNWDQPAAALTEQIAGVLGPGQARLTLRNLSTIASDDIPAIRALLELDLKAHGITPGTDDSANAVRVTLSEDQRERLWVAEIVEGRETKVVMVRVELPIRVAQAAASGLTLHQQPVIATHEPVLAAMEAFGALVTVEPENLVIYAHAADGWQEMKRASIRRKRGIPRDPRAVLRSESQGVEAWLPGTKCEARFAMQWTVECHESDDPWPIVPMPSDPGSATSSTVIPLKAFYNAARNYFTGVVAPNPGVDLPPFYSAAEIPRALGTNALLVNGIDGKVLLVEGGTLKAISGTRDWGSDFALLSSGCGAGAQILVSGSGDAASDSLRAYELPAQEAIPTGAPMAMNGTMLAVSSASDGKSVLATVRGSAGPEVLNRYEVVRVTATCN